MSNAKLATHSVLEQWEMECPKCHEDSRLAITISVEVLLTPHGTVILDGDHDWTDASCCSCQACGWIGTVVDTKNTPVE